jgi:catechol 2,3-dioxygenase-like lactoylglutathione lyase family enzyme
VARPPQRTHHILHVGGDLEVSLAFYVEKLGMTLVERRAWPDPPGETPCLLRFGNCDRSSAAPDTAPPTLLELRHRPGGERSMIGTNG